MKKNSNSDSSQLPNHYDEAFRSRSGLRVASRDFRQGASQVPGSQRVMRSPSSGRWSTSYRRAMVSPSVALMCLMEVRRRSTMCSLHHSSNSALRSHNSATSACSSGLCRLSALAARGHPQRRTERRNHPPNDEPVRRLLRRGCTPLHDGPRRRSRRRRLGTRRRNPNTRKDEHNKEELVSSPLMGLETHHAPSALLVRGPRPLISGALGRGLKVPSTSAPSMHHLRHKTHTVNYGASAM